MTSMSEQPDRDRIAADEQLLAALLAGVEGPAPSALRREIIERNAAPRRRLRRMPTLALGLAGAASAACAALVIALTSSGMTTPPTVASAALVALRTPTSHPPQGLTATGTTILFPDWTAIGWPSSGVRRERLGGRAVTVEFYRSSTAGTVGYAIVSGPQLGWGAPARLRSRHGEPYALISVGGALVVTWVQDGHSCMLASRTTPAAALVALAVAEERGTPL